MLLQTWSDVLVSSFQDLWQELIAYVPNILVSIIIFVVGWVFASLVGKWIASLIRSLKLDSVLQSIGVQDLVNRAGYRLDTGAFFGALVKLFIIVVFLIAALDVLGLQQINSFLEEVVVSYIPNVIAAAIILLLAAVIADILKNIVMGSAQAAGILYADLLGGITKWAIWVFAILAAFNQLNIGAVFAQTLFTGLVAMLALAGGLAFGLGGRDAAARYIERLKEDISKR
jgi:small-conductance mechanosensitive channel